MKTNAERLRARRKAAGLTQQELARKASVSQSTIASIEGSERGFGESVLPIAAVLGVCPYWLAGLDPPANSATHELLGALRECMDELRALRHEVAQMRAEAGAASGRG